MSNILTCPFKYGHYTFLIIYPFSSLHLGSSVEAAVCAEKPRVVHLLQLYGLVTQSPSSVSWVILLPAGHACHIYQRGVLPVLLPGDWALRPVLAAEETHILLVSVTSSFQSWPKSHGGERRRLTGALPLGSAPSSPQLPDTATVPHSWIRPRDTWNLLEAKRFSFQLFTHAFSDNYIEIIFPNICREGAQTTFRARPSYRTQKLKTKKKSLNFLPCCLCLMCDVDKPDVLHCIVSQFANYYMVSTESKKLF